MSGFKATVLISSAASIGGLVGYFSNDIVNWLENPSRNDTCHMNSACAQFKFNKNTATDTTPIYTVNKDSVTIDQDNSQITATLVNSSEATDSAQQLTLNLDFLTDGVLRAYITEDGSEFRISQEGLPVNDNLAKATGATFTTYDDYLEVTNLSSSFGDEGFQYRIDYNSFMITQMNSAGTVTAIVNDQNTLFYEGKAQQEILKEFEEEIELQGIFSQIQQFNSWFDFWGSSSTANDVTEGVGIGVYVPSQTLFGLGEREDTLVLDTTTGSTPYELYATDAPHHPDQKTTLYGQLPIVTGISKAVAQAFYWVNTAHTWVFIDDAADGTGSEVNFVSESGALEFFVFASTAETQIGKLNRNKRIQKTISDLTGPVFFPPLHTLGFHFSKYAPASSDIIRQRNADFSKYNFPVDVLWMDIQWADYDSETAGYEYFQFNPQNFTTDGIAAMNQEVEDAGRFMTVILDPHIKHSDNYFVFSEGEDYAAQGYDEEGNKINVFVQDPNEDADFVGTCWPGESVWIDFLNEKAQEYWGNLYQYNKFVGSSKIYHAWNDMNEPSVFSEETKTLPNLARHYKADGTLVYHRDFHNGYGAFQQRSSYYGILKRDDNTRRPFVLTRSFFVGSQKFGAYWTGDNYSEDLEVYGSMKMLLSNSLVGAMNGGSDVPGFIGDPSDELYIRFYQMGSWEPFFRAHCDINSQNREPWIQSDRVQAAIRDSINRRYDYMHYLYTTFYKATQTGEPLMRTMWSEFPDDESMFTMDTQFMLGDSILIAPKIETPTDELEAQQMQEVTYTLPASTVWFNSDNIKVIGTGQPVTVQLQDLEQAVFKKGGAIIPTLLHDGCLAISQCIDAPIRLDAYLNSYGVAAGSIYMDDGISLDYQDGAYENIAFTFYNNHLTVHAQDSTYESGKTVNEVNVYGYGSLGPLAVTQGGYSVEWTFVTGHLTVTLPSTPIKDLDIVVTMRCAEEETPVTE